MEPQAKDPDRRSVYVDGQFCVGLHQEVIVMASLRVGEHVDGARLLEVLRREEAKRAWDAALLYLTAAARSRQEVVRRLARTYPEPVVETVLSRLDNTGWLDDVAFADSFVRAKPNFGERRLMQELLRRGVSTDVAQKAIDDQLGSVDPVVHAQNLAQRRLERMSGLDRETARRRLTGFLVRRGFGLDAVARALEPLLETLPPTQRKQGRSGLIRRSNLKRREEEQPI